MTMRTLIVLVVACLTANTALSQQRAMRMPVGSFEIDQTEVSIGDFMEYLKSARTDTIAERIGGSHEFAEGGWVRRTGWNYFTPYGRSSSNNEPAVHVSWAEARAYCAHVGGRLPSFAEWRVAAYTEMRDRPSDGFVKGTTYVFPVGDNPEGMNNNRRRHVGVGTTKRGVNGLYDMGGNAWEWVSDRQGDQALTAGGSWWYGPEQTKAEAAQWKAATFTAVYIGFRCAYDRR
jgi:formylglycine-generating enzyme